MKTWSRWQDWVNVLVAALLFVSPWTLGFSAVASAAWSAWILGVLVFTLALWALAYPQLEVPEWCNAVVGVVALAVPFVFGFANLTYPVWSFVVSGLVVLALSTFALYQVRSATARPVHQ